ncbi:helix-turn-helix transcriptional regulator [Echinicola rosea]|uniref:helix-turn-helix transcriptional regulator n=1 Tax=Echinicola rosea TaxID=1807691 RepID=UPI0010CA634C|nr:helix-turn-helix domain-containing protein [Echinicola rosea]
MSSKIRIQRICYQCGREFTAKTTVTKYCGDICAKKAYKKRKKDEKIQQSNIEAIKQSQLPIKKLEEKSFLSINDTCKLLGISRMSLYRLIKSGVVPAKKLGRRTIIYRKNLDLIFNNNCNESTSQKKEDQ